MVASKRVQEEDNPYNKFFRERLTRINKVIEKLEAEFEKAIGKFMKQGEKSSRVLRKNLDEILERISTSDIYSRATEKTEELTREAKKVADEIVSKVKGFDLKRANTFFKDIRGNIDELMGKIQNTEIVEKAKGRAINTRNQFLSVLSIPSQDEVSELSRKVGSLEKKIKTLSKKAA